MCLSATTVPEVTTGRAASLAALGSYKQSWQRVKVFIFFLNGVSYQANVPLVHLIDCRFFFFFVIRVSNSTWLVGSGWAALPPTLAVHMSQ